MARTTMEVPCTCTPQEAEEKVSAILQKEKFHQVTLKSGELVWKSGTGMLTAMKYVKAEYAPNLITLSAWVQMGVGSVGGGDMALTGFVGIIPKKQLLAVLDKIKAAF